MGVLMSWVGMGGYEAEYLTGDKCLDRKGHFGSVSQGLWNSVQSQTVNMQSHPKWHSSLPYLRIKHEMLKKVTCWEEEEEEVFDI